ILIIALLQLIQITIISIIKFVYGFKKLVYNSDEFEVRNSPLDKYASKLA
ncbi:hypothetical protein ACJ73_08468, partial [Blastomyces percursus]